MQSKAQTPDRNCSVCGEAIPQERLEALPDTGTCVRCSNVRPVTDRDVEVDGADPANVAKSSRGWRE